METVEDYFMTNRVARLELYNLKLWKYVTSSVNYIYQIFEYNFMSVNISVSNLNMGNMIWNEEKKIK